MRSLTLLLFSLGWLDPAHASGPSSPAHARTLEAAILLAGPDVSRLPIVLASTTPDEASRGVEAWMLYGADGHAERIVVYSGSDVFRCASDERQDYQCLLKLASIIVHEAWHYRHGPNEADAYATQIAFLTTHGGSDRLVSGVRRSRAYVLAAQQAIEGRR